MRKKANSTKTQTETVVITQPVSLLSSPVVKYNKDLNLTPYSDKLLPPPSAGVYVMVPEKQSVYNCISDEDADVDILFKGKYKLVFGAKNTFNNIIPGSFHTGVVEPTPQYETYVSDGSQLYNQKDIIQLMNNKTKILYAIHKLLPHCGIYPKLLEQRDIDRNYTTYFYTLNYNGCPVMLSKDISNDVFQTKCPDDHLIMLDGQRVSLDHEIPQQLVDAYLNRMKEDIKVWNKQPDQWVEGQNPNTLGIPIKVVDDRYVMADVSNGIPTEEEQNYITTYLTDYILDHIRLGMFPLNSPVKYLPRQRVKGAGWWINTDNNATKSWYSFSHNFDSFEDLVRFSSRVGHHVGLNYYIWGDNFLLRYEGNNPDVYHHLMNSGNHPIADATIRNKISDNTMNIISGQLSQHG